MKYGELTLGQIEAVVNKLGGMDGIDRLLSGQAELTILKHMIDCDAPPLIPVEGWRVESHEKRGKIEWEPKRFSLYLSPNQQEGKAVQGHKLRKELESKKTLPANLLDYLRDHPHLIPEEWKVNEKGQKRFIYFWGTIYRGSVGDLCVRCLYFSGGHWQSRYDWLGSGWGGRDPALLASA